MLFYTAHLIVLARLAITVTSGEHYRCSHTVFCCLVTTCPSLEESGNKGKSAPQLMTQQEGASWPDESHSPVEPFIDWAIMETLCMPILPPHHPMLAGKHSGSFSCYFPILLCTFVYVCSATNVLAGGLQT